MRKETATEMAMEKKEQNMCDDCPLAEREVSRDIEDSENIKCYWCSRKYTTEESMFSHTLVRPYRNYS